MRQTTVGQADGLLHVRCTNTRTGAVTERSVGDIYYRDNANVVFQELLLVAFFGGNGKDYAPPYNTYADFANFRFSNGLVW